MALIRVTLASESLTKSLTGLAPLGIEDVQSGITKEIGSDFAFFNFYFDP
jgi:hypothetical protein